MPEAPEVQTVISTLEVQIHDLQIEEVQVVYPRSWTYNAKPLSNSLPASTFENFFAGGNIFYLSWMTMIW